MKADKKVLREKIASGVVVSLAMLSMFPAVGVEAATCPDGSTITLTNNGDNTVTASVTGHPTTGDWGLCIYYGQAADGAANLPVQTTVPSAGASKTTTASIGDTDEYVGDQWYAEARSGNGCNGERNSAGACQAAATVTPGTGTAAEDETGGAGAGADAGANAGQTVETNGEQVTGVNFLPKINNGSTEGLTFMSLVQNLLKWVLSMAASVALIMLIYGGVMYITSTGDQQKAEQGKKVVTWTVAGLIVILMSYSVILVLDQIFVAA